MKRAPEVGLVLALTFIAIAAWLLPMAGHAAEEAPLTIPADCGSQVCVIPKGVLAALLRAHNQLVEENRRLKGGEKALCPEARESRWIPG